MAKLLEYGVSDNISNKIYHSDTHFTSSTAVKLLYYDIEKYVTQYIQGIREDSDKPAYAMGSYIHSLILEPETISDHYAFFDGFDGRTPGYQAFKQANVGKTVITKAMDMQASKMIESYKKHPVAASLIGPAQKELTLCVDLFGVPVKVRFDAINVEAGEIYDVKTSAYEVDADTFKMQGLGNLKYQVSAGLYTLAAEQHFGKDFTFYFVCMSKRSYATEVFKTGIATMSNGKNQSKIGLERLLHYRNTGKWPETIVKRKATAEIIEI
jgi:hypothetical protein